MIKYSILLIITLLLLQFSCVQKSSKKTIIITLLVPPIKGIKTIGIRGSDKPLNWNTDVEMKEVVKDSLYRDTVSMVTGYMFTEIKFSLNGQTELKNNPPRRIEFNHKDTIYYNAVVDFKN